MIVTKRPTPSVAFTVRVAAIFVLLLSAVRLRLLFVRDERRAYLLVRQHARWAVALTGLRIHVTHAERMPPTGATMMVSNHVSVADAAVLVAALPFDVRFVANHIYAGYPLLGPVIRSASANIVNRTSWRSRADSGQAMRDALEAGRSLLVFPEGTTSDSDEMLPFRSGAFRAAARTGCPVVPIALTGTRELMASNRWLLAKAEVTVEILEPIVPPPPTREGIADLGARAAEAIRVALARAHRVDDPVEAGGAGRVP